MLTSFSTPPPGAAPRDGREPLVRAFRRGGWTVELVETERFLAALPRVMRGTHGGMKEVTMVRTRSLLNVLVAR